MGGSGAARGEPAARPTPLVTDTPGLERIRIVVTSGEIRSITWTVPADAGSLLLGCRIAAHDERGMAGLVRAVGPGGTLLSPPPGTPGLAIPAAPRPGGQDGRAPVRGDTLGAREFTGTGGAVGRHERRPDNAEEQPEMTYVIAEPCVDVMDQACVAVCPVDCIHFEQGTDRILYIDPNECIDCGACEPECPVNAIFPEESLPAAWAPYTPINATWFTDKTKARAMLEALKPA